MADWKNKLFFGDNLAILLAGGVLLTIMVLLALTGRGNRNGTSPPPAQPSPPKRPEAKLVSYEAPFRRNFGKVTHLSLVVYFPAKIGVVSPYGCRYTVRHVATGRAFQGDQKHNFHIKPCEWGYTGAQEILNSPRGYRFFAEVILKARQTPVKPGRISRSDPEPVQDDEWWITKGMDLPSFDAADYSVDSVTIYDKQNGTVMWQLPN